MEFIEFFGACVAVSGIGALLNYSLKAFGRRYLPALNKRNKQMASRYRMFMQFMVKNHRYFGFATAILVAVHFTSAFLFPAYSITGLITVTLLLLVILLGIYGFYIRKDYRSAWLSVHRTAAFLLAASAAVHVFAKSIFPASSFY
jgi:hypothetical protein